MKPRMVCFVSFMLFVNLTLRSQQPVPSDADAFYKKAMSSINAKHITWIKRTAITSNSQSLDESGIRKLASGYAGQFNLDNMDVEALVILIMMQTANDSEKDLKDMMAEMRKRNEEKQRLREAMEKMKENNTMTRQRLDSFRLLTKPEVKTVTATQPTRLQTTPTVTKVNKPINQQISQAEIKQVQDSLKLKMDSMSEMNQERSMRLQMMMDKRSKAMETLSNIMKKISETQDTIISNLK